MDALARSLEQTKRQLRAVQGDQTPASDYAPTPRSPSSAPRPTAPRPPVMVQGNQPPADDNLPTPRASRDAVRARTQTPRATAPLPPANEYQRSDDQPRPRLSRERPIEERLSRLEEQMSQIANDLHALRSNSPSLDAPTQPAPATYPRTRPQAAADPFGQPGSPRPVHSFPADAADPTVPTTEAPAVPAPPAPVRPPRPSSDTSAPRGLTPPATPSEPTGTDPLPALAPPKPDAVPSVPSSEVPAVPAPPAPVSPRRPSSDIVAPPVLIQLPATSADRSAIAPPLPLVPAKPLTINTKKFSIPFIIPDELKDTVRELELSVSLDYGKSWRKAASQRPTEKEGSFTYMAPTDGSYWFRVEAFDGNGNRQPILHTSGVLLKVQIDTSAPKAETDAAPAGVTSRVVEDYVGQGR